MNAFTNYLISYCCRKQKPTMSPLRKQGSRARKSWIPASAGMTNIVSATGTNYLRYYWYPISILLIQYQQIAAGCWMLVSRIACCVLRNDRVAVPLFFKGFCLAREIIPKYLRYYLYPISSLLIQYQQIAAGCWMLVSEE